MLTMTAATDLRDVRAELDARGFDRRLRRMGLLVVDGERQERIRLERDDEREQRTNPDRVQRAIHWRPASDVGHDVRQLVVRQVDVLQTWHRGRLPRMPDAVTDGAIPVSRCKAARDASIAAREIRRGPIAGDELIDDHSPAEVGAVTAVAGHPRLD